MMCFGKHAVFIWSSYGVAVLSLCLIAIFSWRQMRRLEVAANALKREHDA
jgi:heme exporter protein CcmD